MFVHDVALLACPDSGAPLAFEGTNLETRLMDGVLVSVEARTAWGVEEGLARLCRETETTPGRARLDALEDRVPRLHDPIVRLLPQVLGGGGGPARRALFDRLALADLAPGPVRILEVGVATGQNLSPLLDALPAGVEAELWGTDTRAGLLAQCKDRCGDDPRLLPTRLVMAAPGRLPFQAGVFDRVLYVGGLHGQAEPRAVVAELMRVTRPEGRVVVADERADASGGLTGWRRRLLAALGATEGRLSPLAELAPPDARGVSASELDPVLEVLTFQPPAGS